MTPDDITELRDGLGTFELDPSTRSRLRAALDSYVDRADPSAQSSRAPARRRRSALGVAVLGAAVVLLVIALDPTGARHERGDHGSTRSSLLTAALAAGRAPWQPLGERQFHHVYFTTFNPTIPTVLGMDDRQMAGGFMPNPMATESWFRPDGRGLTAEISGGGGDPSRYPEIHPDSRGQILGYGGTLGGMDPVKDVKASLRYADFVRTWSYLPDAKTPDDQLWYRTRRGYIQGAHFQGNGLPIPNLSAGERSMVRLWGDTYANVSALDRLRGPALDRAVVRLLDGNPRAALKEAPDEGPVGPFGLTAEQARKERRIHRAIQLLGTAPLAPRARESMFRWLAKQDGATIQEDTVDAIGRHGTRVTFGLIHDEAVPAHDATLDELRAAAVQYRDTPPPTHVEGAKPSYPVRAHHAQRRWYVTFVFDPRHGELLEQVQYTGERTTTPIPQLSVSGFPPRDPYVWRVESRPLFGVMTDSALYFTRERSARVDPDSAVCQDDPRICGSGASVSAPG